MLTSMIVAMTEDGLIGRAGGLPWHLSNDLRRFKQLTMGHHIVMGRKTHESIGRLLPGRSTVILTRQTGYRVPGAEVVASLAEALTRSAGDSHVFVIGGRQVYQAAIEQVDRMYRTVVHADLNGDVYFPEFHLDDWELVEEENGRADERNDYDHTFQQLQRKKRR